MTEDSRLAELYNNTIDESRITELYKKLKSKNTTHFSVTWGPEGVKLTEEEKADYLLKLMNGIEDGTIEHTIHADFPELPRKQS